MLPFITTKLIILDNNDRSTNNTLAIELHNKETKKEYN